MRRSRTSSPFTTTTPALLGKANCTSSSSTSSTPCSTTLSRHPAEQRQHEVEFRCDGHPGPGQSISRDRSFQADGAAQLVGDTNLGLKWNFHKEHPDSCLPAFSATFYCEFPTVGTSRQLGSGVVDYWLKGIVQKNIPARTKITGNNSTASSESRRAGECTPREAGGSKIHGAPGPGAAATNCGRAWPSISVCRVADTVQVPSWEHKSASSSIFPLSPVPALVPNGSRSTRAQRVDTLVECAPG